MGFLSSPKAPDYVGAAQTQGQQSQELANQATWADRPNQNTPWGQTTWDANAGIDPATGQPITRWDQTTTLAPNAQQALDSQINMQAGRSGLAESLIGRTNQELATPFDWNSMPSPAGAPDVPDFYGQGLPGMSDIPDANANAMAYSPLAQSYNAEGGGSAGSGYNPAFAKTYYDRQMSLLGPQQESQRKALEVQMRNQGLDPSSQASTGQTNSLRNQQGEDLNRLSADSVFRGLQEQQAEFGRLRDTQAMYNQGVDSSFDRQMGTAQYGDQQRGQLVGEQLAYGGQMFDQQMQQGNYQNRLRQQAIAEEAQRRGMSINEMNALISGQQVNMPQMPNFNQSTVGDPADLNSAAKNQGNFDAANYGSMTGMLGNAFGLGYTP
jgi:hypothetical protein